MILIIGTSEDDIFFLNRKREISKKLLITIIIKLSLATSVIKDFALLME